MNTVTTKKALNFGPLLVLLAIVFFLAVFPAALTGAEEGTAGGLITDPLKTASFIPPPGWVRWDFWGTTAFSPTTEHDPRLTFSVTPGEYPDPDRDRLAMEEYEKTFSTKNYTIIKKEYLYLAGWSGIRILVRGTEANTLFDGDYIWIQEYYTKHHKIALVFRSSPSLFETYRDTVLKSLRTLIIIERMTDG